MQTVTVRVWVDEWQFACCGAPFAVGSVVEWTVRPAANAAALSTVADGDTARSVDGYEERHGGDPDDPADAENLSLVTGVVLGIWASYHHHAPAPPRKGKYRPVSETDRLVPLPDTYGENPGINGMDLHGYVVDLKVW